MKKSGYMTRALRSNDRRYARVLSKLGYQRSDMVAEPSFDGITTARADYERVLGKKPFMGWDVSTLRAKIAEAQDPTSQNDAPTSTETPADLSKGCE